MKLQWKHQIIQDFWIEGRGGKCIIFEMKEAFRENAYSESQIKFWLARFKESGVNCEDQSRPWRRPTDFGPAWQHFVAKFPFSVAEGTVPHCLVPSSNVKDISINIWEYVDSDENRRHFVAEALKRREWTADSPSFKFPRTWPILNLMEPQEATSRDLQLFSIRRKCLQHREMRSLQR
jgi:hypothetical protein